MTLINSVIPNKEFVPERQYNRRGNVVYIHNVKSVGACGEVLCGTNILDKIVFKDDEMAKLFMEDIYYGEYTGG